ncbi:MAG: hypothetical protein ABS36_19275 [Acidobacteria bacterium SCN 69-37]|nr:MAG: hypothetical protein ABS36_19275 [Acidobacteria bacterium SCN 69-37]
MVLLALVAAGAVWWIFVRVGTPYRGFTGGEVFVELPAGTSVSGMADRLAAAGIVPDALTFRLAARLSGQERRLQAGEYRFADAATPTEVVARLARGDVFVLPITFREGLTIPEMAGVFEAAGLGPAESFRTAAGRVDLIRDLDPAADDLEGYLFPSTYTVSRRTTADELVAAMVSQFRRVYADLRGRADTSSLSLREIVTLASVVERETAAPDERPMVAAVFLNRLRRGMPLQTDPTVIYAMMRLGRWTGNIRRSDLQMEHPYNTYRNPGLPPGPIAAPGRSALEAVLDPANVPYLYFVSRNDGTHVFSSTLTEHNRAVNEWQRRRR